MWLTSDVCIASISASHPSPTSLARQGVARLGSCSGARRVAVFTLNALPDRRSLKAEAVENNANKYVVTKRSKMKPRAARAFEREAAQDMALPMPRVQRVEGIGRRLADVLPVN
jgi:hypothetical protein